MITKLSHIGIAVPKIEEAIVFYREKLGLKETGREEVAEQRVRVAMLEIGETRIELLESTSPDGPIAKFLEKKGPGLHHIAVATTDIESDLAKLKAAGVRLIDEKPRAGAHGARIAFVHPAATGGVLTELCEEPPKK